MTTTSPAAGPAGAPTLSVVMPVYNERATIDEILRRVDAVAVEGGKEVIIVDDGSTDGTRERLDAWRGRPGFDIVFHERNRGKGGALRTAFSRARGRITLIQDADLEYDPAEYPQLLAPILDGRADVVYGSRFLGGPHRVLFFWHYVGNKALTLITNAICDVNLSDMETCYKVFRTELLGRMQLESNDFAIEPELTVAFTRMGCRIYEVPISYSGRTYAEGKKIGWKDGVRAATALVRFRFLK